ncbi:MAG: succinate dehydrogenase assembly factor 2 [Alphaproteobacteria bacterium]|nr:MAG: succinate dehydrogenase assembly factor 2 [Alphaproteobacteria bacterium]
MDHEQHDHHLETRRRRALFRAEHRGTKEMDWILGRFARSALATMSESELGTFEELLGLPDPDIEQWVVYGRGGAPDSALASLIARIRAFHEI